MIYSIFLIFSNILTTSHLSIKFGVPPLNFLIYESDLGEVSFVVICQLLDEVSDTSQVKELHVHFVLEV